MSVEKRMEKLQKSYDARMAEKESRGGDQKNDLMSLKYGDTTLFILPELGEDANLNCEVSLHFGFLAKDNEGKEVHRAYKCTKETHGACPMCDAAEQFYKTDKKRFDDLKAKRMFLYNVLDPEGNNRVLSAKPSQQEAIDAEILSTFKVDNVDVTNLNGGRKLLITRTKEMPWCRARVINQTVTFTSEEQKRIVSNMKDLTKFHVDYTPDELRRVINGELIDKSNQLNKNEINDNPPFEDNKKKQATTQQTMNTADVNTEAKATADTQQGNLTVDEILRQLNE